MKTRSPQTMGVELPRSGKDVLQRTFSVALHRVGRFFSKETPVPCGPRHCGQLSAGSERIGHKASATENIFRQRRDGLVIILGRIIRGRKFGREELPCETRPPTRVGSFNFLYESAELNRR